MAIPFFALIGTFFTWLPQAMYYFIGAICVISVIALLLKVIAFIWDVIPLL